MALVAILNQHGPNLLFEEFDVGRIGIGGFCQWNLLAPEEPGKKGSGDFSGEPLAHDFILGVAILEASVSAFPRLVMSLS